MATFEFHKGSPSLDNTFYWLVVQHFYENIEHLSPVYQRCYRGTFLFIVDPMKPQTMYLKAHGEYPEFYYLFHHLSDLNHALISIIKLYAEKYNYATI